MEATDVTELHTWLREHGVSKRMTNAIMQRSGCSTVSSFALYLRFQLPPVRLANRASIANEMRELLGVAPRKAHQIVEDLDISGMPVQAASIDCCLDF
jgi:hypothetical protein